MRLPGTPKPPSLTDADSPAELSSGAWRKIVVETVHSSLKHRVPATAAAASFYGFVGFAPAIAGFGAAIGLFAGPERLNHQLDAFGDVVPASVLGLVRGEAIRFAHGPRERLGLAVVVFALAALLSVTSSVRCLMEGLNLAYRAEEHRHWVRRRLLALAFAAGVVAAFAADAALVIRSGDYLSREPDVVWPTVRLVLRWASLFALSVAALALLYRYAPDRRRARWRWVTPGSFVTAGVGLLVSAAMAIYLARFANYEHTYGGLGSVLGLVVWMWSSMIVVLGGAELNWAMENATSAVTDISGRPTTPPATV